MAKSHYKDYAKASKYFNSEDDELLKNDIKNAEKQKNFVVWVQEFSKKVVIVVSFLFIIFSIASLFLIYLSYKDGTLMGLETLISESNETFRIVIGGYIIKSAVENAFKIGGNYFVGITDARLNAMMMKHNMNTQDNYDIPIEDEEIIEY